MALGSVLDPVRSCPIFAPLDRALTAQSEKALEKGVPVSAARAGKVSPLRFLLLAASFGFFFICAFCSDLYFLPSLLRNLLSFLALAASAWCLVAFALFWSRFALGIPAATRLLSAFIRDARLVNCEKDRKGRDVPVSSVRLAYFLEDGGRLLVVRAFDDVAWHGSVQSLDSLGIAAALGVPLERKEVRTCWVDYVFVLAEERRIDALARISEDAPACTGVRDSVPLSESVSWRFSKLPHMLVAGGTGGGKSTFLFYLLAEFLRLGDAEGGAADVFICDPKNAELASLSCVFGSDRVGVSPAQIAGVVRRCREEMDRRYAWMQSPERFRFGASAFDYGLNPVFLVFDEVAAFKAEADRKTFEEVWGNLTQLVLKARAANVFVILAMQQPRAEVVSTDIRDNLGARVSLGKLSAEGYRMVFGNGFSDYQPIEERGAGYIMLDGWDAPKPFKAPFADYSRVDYPRALKRLHAAAQSRNRHHGGMVDGGAPAESAS